MLTLLLCFVFVSLVAMTQAASVLATNDVGLNLDSGRSLMGMLRD